MQARMSGERVGKMESGAVTACERVSILLWVRSLGHRAMISDFSMHGVTTERLSLSMYYVSN